MADDEPRNSHRRPKTPRSESSRRPASAATSSRARRSPPGSCCAGSLLILAMMAPWTSAEPRRELHAAPRQCRSVRGRRPGLRPVLRRASARRRSRWSRWCRWSSSMVFAIAANLVQHRPLLSVEPITPKLSKISPIDGFRRLFSVEALVNFAQGPRQDRHRRGRSCSTCSGPSATGSSRWSPPIRR